jgi:hypothetical protein
MYKLLQVALAVSFTVSFNVLQQAPAFAQAAPPALTGPTEVGTTTMVAGQYQVTDKANGKVYDLMVTGKGSMILSPSSSVAAVSAPTASAAATVGASAPVINPTAATGAAAATAASPATAAAAPAGASSAINNLVNQGMQRGMTELMKRGATNQLKNLVK